MAIEPTTYLKARAFALWVRHVTGTEPAIVEKSATLPDGSTHEYLEVEFTPEQRSAMIAWLDGQVGGLLESDRPPRDLQIDFGGIMLPWSMRYLLPVGLGLVALGYVGRYLTERR